MPTGKERPECGLDGCSRPHKAHGLCRFHWIRQRQGVPFTQPRRAVRGRQIKYCPWCWTLFNKKYSGGERSQNRYCSKSCAAQHQGLISREATQLKAIAKAWATPCKPIYRASVRREIQALKRIARYVERPAFYRCNCKGCSVQVIRRSRITKALCTPCLRRKHRQTDSYKAGKRIHKAKRKVRMGVKAERIDPFKVFERDGWKCQLCGVDTPRSLRGSYEDSAPELDHIKPLALDGEHTWLNVQCACRKCNIRKGATYGAGPFRMVC
jgi:5-methylcytosine-specific restriction endonuclease McrA